MVGEGAPVQDERNIQGSPILKQTPDVIFKKSRRVILFLE
jgi:hypothetical protein